MSSRKGKYQVAFGLENLPRMTQTVGVTTAEFAKKNPDKLRAIIAARRAAVDYLYAEPEKAAKLIAKAYGKNCMGVILTGMGEDGATGMLDIKQVGGTTIVQDENSSAIFGMPKAAIDAGAVDKILNVDEIGQFLVNKAMRNP